MRILALYFLLLSTFAKAIDCSDLYWNELYIDSSDDWCEELEHFPYPELLKQMDQIHHKIADYFQVSVEDLMQGGVDLTLQQTELDFIDSRGGEGEIDLGYSDLQSGKLTEMHLYIYAHELGHNILAGHVGRIASEKVKFLEKSFLLSEALADFVALSILEAERPHSDYANEINQAMRVPLDQSYKTSHWKLYPEVALRRFLTSCDKIETPRESDLRLCHALQETFGFFVQPLTPDDNQMISIDWLQLRITENSLYGSFSEHEIAMPFVAYLRQLGIQGVELFEIINQTPWSSLSDCDEPVLLWSDVMKSIPQNELLWEQLNLELGVELADEIQKFECGK